MEEKILHLYNYLLERKYKDVAVYDISNEKQDFDYLFITSCPDEMTNKKIAKSIVEEFGLEQMPEGYNKGEWIIFDLDDIIIHCFTIRAREKYNLDKLWQSKKIELAKKKGKNSN